MDTKHHLNFNGAHNITNKAQGTVNYSLWYQFSFHQQESWLPHGYQYNQMLTCPQPVYLVLLAVFLVAPVWI